MEFRVLLSQLSSGRIQFGGGGPKSPQELHTTGILPKVGRHDSALASGARHLAYRLVMIGHEIQHEPRDYNVERGAFDR